MIEDSGLKQGFQNHQYFASAYSTHPPVMTRALSKSEIEKDIS
jgi:hypothetical protein